MKRKNSPRPGTNLIVSGADEPKFGYGNVMSAATVAKRMKMFLEGPQAAAEQIPRVLLAS